MKILLLFSIGGGVLMVGGFVFNPQSILGTFLGIIGLVLFLFPCVFYMIKKGDTNGNKLHEM